MEQTILVVEDEEAIRQLIVDYLKHGGYQVVIASNGKEALERIEDTTFDLAILDVMLPFVDGWTLCRKIRKAKEVPILFLTARGEEDDELMGFEIGADDYMKKPFSGNVLVARVNRLLNKKSTEVKVTSARICKDHLAIDKEAMRVSVDGVVDRKSVV